MATVNGTSGDDQLFPVRDEDNEIFGLGGNDVLFAGSSNDTFDGGTGFDAVRFGTFLDGGPIFVNGVVASLKAGSASANVGSEVYTFELLNIEQLNGSDFNDILTGDDTDNELQGLPGDDVIFGEDGDDRIFAGGGNDTLDGGANNDSLFAGVGNLLMDGGDGIDLAAFSTTSGGNPIFVNGVVADLDSGTGAAQLDFDRFAFTLLNFEDLTGSDFGDTLSGDEENNEIQGRRGDDVIDANGGDDRVFAGSGDDTVDGGTGNDTLFADAGNDILDGGEGVDRVAFDTTTSGEEVFSNGVTVNIGDGTASAQIDNQSYLYALSNFEDIDGSNFEDMLVGDAGDNQIRGFDGDDILMGGAGNDTLEGNGGNDIALYDGTSTHFTVQYRVAEQQAFIIDRTGDEGTDQGGANILRFADRDITQVADGDLYYDANSFTQTEFLSLVELYIAYFNRAPDAEGLNFWTLAVINGTSLDQAAEFFFDQPETRALYGNTPDTPTFVTSVYQNVLGRGPDDIGLDFWVTSLTNGEVSEGQFIRDFLLGARADPPADAPSDFVDQQNADRIFLDTKTDIGVNFGAILGMSNIANANAVMSLFDGSDSSLSSAIEATDDAYQAALATDGSGELLLQLIGFVDDPFAI